MNARSAVSWILGKLQSAESLCSRLLGEGQGLSDYSLTLSCEEDEEFFMTDFAHELLEAAGFRNDR